MAIGPSTRGPRALLVADAENQLDAGYGALAAARALGRAGIPVAMASPRAIDVAQGSRYVSARLRSPSVQEPNRLLAWLVARGRDLPGQVLYPTSPEQFWLFTLHRDLLERFFRVWLPEHGAAAALLEKRQLFALAARANLAVPLARFPENEQALERLLPKVSYPIDLCPRTELFFTSPLRAIRAGDPSELREAWRAWSRHPRAKKLAAHAPEAQLPMLLEQRPRQSAERYCLTGLMDEKGERVGERASVRLAPRTFAKSGVPLGATLLYEEAPLEETLARNVAAMLRAVGFFGPYEAEFAKLPGRHLLLDLRPGLHGRTGFDVARGLPTPLYVYTASARAERPLPPTSREELYPQRARRIFAHRVELEAARLVRRLSVRRGSPELERARQLMARRQGVDPVFDMEDLLPTALDLAARLRERLFSALMGRSPALS